VEQAAVMLVRMATAVAETVVVEAAVEKVAITAATMVRSVVAGLVATAVIALAIWGTVAMPATAATVAIVAIVATTATAATAVIAMVVAATSAIPAAVWKLEAILEIVELGQDTRPRSFPSTPPRIGLSSIRRPRVSRHMPGGRTGFPLRVASSGAPTSAGRRAASLMG